MQSINTFTSNVYGGENFSTSESEYGEVITASADFAGYSEWSEDLEQMPFSEGNIENFEIVNGNLRYKGEQLQRRHSVGGIEI